VWHSGPPGDRRAYAVRDLTRFEGGQGQVVRADRRTFPGDPVGVTGRVALKLTTEHTPERVAVITERWTRLSRVRHESLARALEAFEGPALFRTDTPPETDDVFYTAACWVDGESLRRQAPVDPPAACALARDLAGGLAALHAHGLVHRDVHPGNVIVRPDGRAVLIDLGCARDDDGSSTCTVTGALGFIAPESTCGPGDAATDRWGLGMVTVFALLGHPQGSASRACLERDLRDSLAGVGDPRRAVELLTSMVDPDPGSRPTDAEAWAAALAACLPPRRSARRRRAAGLVAAMLGGFAAAAAVAALLIGGGDREEQRDAPEAVPEPECVPPAAAAGANPDLIAAVDRLAPGSCARGGVDRLLEAWALPLADRDGSADGVVLATPRGTALRLTDAMWASYKEIAGRSSPENAILLGGYPMAVERLPGTDVTIVRLESGGMMLARRDDSQFFWVPAQALDAWNAHGGPTGDLGLPTSNPYFVGGQIVLDFEGGYMADEMTALVSLMLGAKVESAVVLDAAARDEPLAGIEIHERIVRQPSGTAWWVDADGVRHWIPDGEGWYCRGGDQAVAAGEVPGWAVATLPLGPADACR
jgi:hypothetical protein